ncbi:MAG: ATP-binding protein [Actinomycetota bacterium]|nr:ATP-binding protein [Actinomycetota bacterium]
MTEVVELEIPALPEFVGIARMAVAALAGVRPGLEYDRVDDLRIVVSEACTSAIEAYSATAGAPLARVRLHCHDGPERLEVAIAGPAGAFDSAVAGPDVEEDSGFRISLIRALVDEADVQATAAGSELRLVVHRQVAGSDGDLPA